MTIDRKETISIPKWLLLLAIPTIMGVFGSLLSSAVAKGSLGKQVEVNTIQLDKLETNKVNVTEFEMVKELLVEIKGENKQQLTRIENKLDDHIKQGTILRMVK